ncbi:MAG TPA: hypothetical protein VL096_17860 [Pirellulaceae bacterium]|nr:hypothetical protein [Pirellulaceae bacterium]
MRLRWNRILVLACSALLPLGISAIAQAQVAELQAVEIQIRAAQPALPPGAAPVPTKPEDKKPEEKKEDAPAEVVRPAVPVNPKIIVLHLQDGSIITGEMAIEEITVTTEFGPLNVPLTKVRSLMPGLSSSPEMAGKVNGLIEALGSDDYKAREQSHKDLSALGLKVHRLVEARRNDENAERKRHIGELLKEFEELAAEQEELNEGGTPADPAWIQQDTVVTADFTIVGKVSPAEFKVSSKYGPLTVQLADLRRADRPTGSKESLRKLVNVPGDSLVQRTFKNSGIKVEAGDKISVKADGSVVMTPWGSDQSSNPDGGANFGWYVPNQIYGGALVAKIGDKGQVFKVGSKSTFVAKTSGVLQFAVAMQQQYAQPGYNFPGQYNVRVTVDPK